ncbi:MAG: hypothetical protein ACLFTB_01320 [Desulfovibrionales bacterium]
MGGHLNSSLQMRLLNCLETIVELEEELDAADSGLNITEELKILKSVMERIDTLEINESDVIRVEQATMSFLKELQGPLQSILKKNRQILQ